MGSIGNFYIYPTLSVCLSVCSERSAGISGHVCQRLQGGRHGAEGPLRPEGAALGGAEGPRGAEGKAPPVPKFFLGVKTGCKATHNHLVFK